MEDPPGGWFSRILGRKRKDVSVLIEQELSEEAYSRYRELLLRARPEVYGDKVILRLAEGTVELKPNSLIVRAKNRESAHKILRNLHHYERPPSLWPSYGLSYSIRRREKT